MRNKYQRDQRKSNRKFEVVGGQELLVRVPLPMAEVWAEMQAHVERLTGEAGLQILRAILGTRKKVSLVEQRASGRRSPQFSRNSELATRIDKRNFGTRSLAEFR